MTPLADARLSPEAFARARAFLLDRGRPLEQARFRHDFEGGAVGEVLDALRAYRNPDGGFGHALEPDVRAPGSSVLATSVALEVLHSLNVGAEEPLLRGAVTWLRSQLRADPHGTVWPFLPPRRRPPRTRRGGTRGKKGSLRRPSGASGSTPAPGSWPVSTAGQG